MSIEGTTERRPRSEGVTSTTKWLRPRAQGCCTRATLGNSSDGSRNPDGVEALLCVKGAMSSPGDNDSRQSNPLDQLRRHNPVGVGELARRVSQGSRVQQPWARRRIPFGDDVQTLARCVGVTLSC